MMRIKNFSYYDNSQSFEPAGQQSTLNVNLAGGVPETSGLMFNFKGLRPEAAIEKIKKLVEFLDGEVGL